MLSDGRGLGQRRRATPSGLSIPGPCRSSSGPGAQRRADDAEHETGDAQPQDAGASGGDGGRPCGNRSGRKISASENQTLVVPRVSHATQTAA